MINTGLAAAIVGLSTLCTVIYIGLGFLPRPSRAAALWAVSFSGFMVASYVWVGAETMESAPLRAVASGIMLGMLGLIWLGLRVGRGSRGGRGASVIAAAGYLVATPVLLALFSEGEFYLTVLRLVFAAGGVFAALIVAECIRLGPHVRDEILPLALATGAYVVLAVFSLLHEVVRLATQGPAGAAVDVSRDINVMGSLLFLVCAVTTLLLLTRQSRQPDGAASSAARGGSFAAVASDRLRRAAAADDKWWGLLVVRLDDPATLRAASSTHAFDQLADRFGEVVRANLPAEADIGASDDTTFTVLLPRPEGAVRQVLARLLEEVAEIGPDSPLAVRLSASVGWAGVDAVGYDLDDLVAAAAAAADRAAELGGDRWERVTPV